MKQILGSSPRTSIIGIGKALMVLLLPIFQKEGFDIKKDWPYIVGAILMYLGGRVAKDSNGITIKEDVITAKAATDNTIPPTKDRSNRQY